MTTTTIATDENKAYGRVSTTATTTKLQIAVQVLLIVLHGVLLFYYRFSLGSQVLLFFVIVKNNFLYGNKGRFILVRQLLVFFIAPAPFPRHRYLLWLEILILFDIIKFKPPFFSIALFMDGVFVATFIKFDCFFRVTFLSLVSGLYFLLYRT